MILLHSTSTEERIDPFDDGNKMSLCIILENFNYKLLLKIFVRLQPGITIEIENAARDTLNAIATHHSRIKK